MRPDNSEALPEAEFNRLILLVELEGKRQWGKKANVFIQQEENYCLDAAAVTSTVWRYPAGVMLNSYVPPVLQARRAHHGYSTHQVLTFVHFLFKNLEPEISRVSLHWQVAWTSCMDTTRNPVWMGCKDYTRQLHFSDLNVNCISAWNVVSLHFA